MLRTRHAIIIAAYFLLTTAMTGCGSNSRDLSYRGSLSQVCSSSVDTYQKKGSEDPKIVKTTPFYEYFGKSWNPGFVFLQPGQGEPSLESEFSSAMEKVYSPPEDLIMRAQAADNARTALRTILSKAQTDEFKVIIRLNICLIDLSLHDKEAFSSDIETLPPKRTKQEIYMDGITNAIAHPYTTRELADILRDYAHNWYTTGHVIRGHESHVVNQGYKISTPARAPVFKFAEGSGEKLVFPSIEARLLAYDSSRKVLNIKIVMKNLTQRVIGFQNMAVRMTHNGAETVYKTVNAEYRLLPGDTTEVEFSHDQNLSYSVVLARATQNSPTEFTLYDVPTVWDDLGNVTKKENLTWKFFHDPGSDAVMEPDPSQNIVEWLAFQRGADRIKRP
jgi:hypothetical protein